MLLIFGVLVVMRLYEVFWSLWSCWGLCGWLGDALVTQGVGLGLDSGVGGESELGCTWLYIGVDMSVFWRAWVLR